MARFCVFSTKRAAEKSEFGVPQKLEKPKSSVSHGGDFLLCMLDPEVWTGAVPFAGKTEEAPQLLADGPDIEEMGGLSDDTPLVAAASQGQGPVLLLEHGADMSGDGRTLSSNISTDGGDRAHVATQQQGHGAVSLKAPGTVGATPKTAPAAPAKEELDHGEVVESEGGDADESMGQESAGEREDWEVCLRPAHTPSCPFPCRSPPYPAANHPCRRPAYPPSCPSPRHAHVSDSAPFQERQESAGGRDDGEVVESKGEDAAWSRGQRMTAALSIIRSAAHGQVRP